MDTARTKGHIYLGNWGSPSKQRTIGRGHFRRVECLNTWPYQIVPGMRHWPNKIVRPFLLEQLPLDYWPSKFVLSNRDQWEESSVCADQSNRGPQKERGHWNIFLHNHLGFSCNFLRTRPSLFVHKHLEMCTCTITPVFTDLYDF